MRPAIHPRRDLKSLWRSVAIAAGIFLALATTAPAEPSLATAVPAPPQQPESYDLLVVNGRLVDGTGNAWIYADLGIRADRIARITPRGGLDGAAAGETIDATSATAS